MRHWSVGRRSIVGPGLGAFLRSNYLGLRNGFSNADRSRVDRLDIAEVDTTRVGGLGQRVTALRRIWILLLGRGLLIGRLLSLRCIIVLSSFKDVSRCFHCLRVRRIPRAAKIAAMLGCWSPMVRSSKDCSKDSLSVQVESTSKMRKQVRVTSKF